MEETLLTNPTLEPYVYARIREIIEATRALKPEGFLENLCDNRADFGENRVGSYWVNLTRPAVLGLVSELRWKKIRGPYGNKSYTLYRADNISQLARIGIGPLHEFSKDFPVKLEDLRGSGRLIPSIFGVPGDKVHHAHLVTELNHGEEVIETFFPGDPIDENPWVESSDELTNKIITVREAMEEYGFVFAMLRPDDVL